ncbi:periplasmic molybdate-binding protein [Deinococcus aerius]|uniref:Periplasmic molybdate-binding protein n=1 Tax=Deinococcus aerius TaxID=200253 RepID=A0A2I9DXE9_9DEIO|nr:substrate-binding domain-containing protein [Deinococcus aerius]GBF07847.1 periplasmic molybdate-binding protein [Deinococcus aerius]
MPGAEGEVRARVREVREAAGLRPAELARRAGLSRQALHAIETNTHVPGTVTALRLARALGCRVEDLFHLPGAPLFARLVGRSVSPGTRVRLAEVGGRLLAFPLGGEEALRAPADGLTTGEVADGAVRVELLVDAGLPGRTAVVAGCDPSLGLLAPHAARLGPGTRVLWRDLPSLDALRALACGEAHAAGIHLWDPGSGESNRPFVTRELGGRPAHLFTLWDWEQGLIVAPGNPRGIVTPSDLARPGVTLANRAEGAGSRVLLDTWLEAAGLTPAERARLPGYATAHPTHLALAGSVARGEADAGPGPRAAARALGLDFVPLQRERFDLVVPAEHLGHPGVRALLAAAREDAFHAELAALGGYDPAHAGELWHITA